MSFKLHEVEIKDMLGRAPSKGSYLVTQFKKEGAGRRSYEDQPLFEDPRMAVESALALLRQKADAIFISTTVADRPAVVMVEHVSGYARLGKINLEASDGAPVVLKFRLTVPEEDGYAQSTYLSISDACRDAFNAALDSWHVLVYGISELPVQFARLDIQPRLRQKQ